MNYILLSIPLAYLVGGIPTGYWFARLFFGVDVTKNGSGNIGATNVARVLGNKLWFFPIFFFDFAKSFGMFLVVDQLLAGRGEIFTPWHISLIAVALLVGNGCSPFLKFKGGKGVATMCGILAFVMPLFFCLFMVVFGVIIAAVRRVDIAALSGIMVTTGVYLLPLWGQDLQFVPLLVFVVGWLVWRHQENIARAG